MRLLAGLVLTVILSTPAAAAETPEPLWVTKDLALPESVVLDPASDALYVSNIGGEVMKKDGNGFIAKLKPDGSLVEREWLTGLDGPTGLALHGGKLYVADISQLVEIDIAGKKIVNRYPAKDAIFLNDVVAAGDGTVYVSDTMTNTIWRLKDGTFEPWLKDEALNGPNGLLVQGDELIVTQFGKLPEEGKEAVLGGLLSISTNDKSVRKLGSGKPIGNLDGIELLEPGVYLVTDWAEGALYRIDSEGKAERLIDMNKGSADHLYLPETKTVLIPMMIDNSLAAYSLK